MVPHDSNSDMPLLQGSAKTRHVKKPKQPSLYDLLLEGGASFYFFCFTITLLIVHELSSSTTIKCSNI